MIPPKPWEKELIVLGTARLYSTQPLSSSTCIALPRIFFLGYHSLLTDLAYESFPLIHLLHSSQTSKFLIWACQPYIYLQDTLLFQVSIPLHIFSLKCNIKMILFSLYFNHINNEHFDGRRCVTHLLSPTFSIMPNMKSTYDHNN